MSSLYNPKRILVTGGAGFIGSHLCESLARQDIQVTIIDNLVTGLSANLKHIPDTHFDFINSSLSDALPEMDINSFDGIFHLAAAVGVQLILERPVETIETNIIETSRLLQLASTHRIPTLITSSSEVYGKSTKIPFNEDDDVMYGCTTYTRWSYACTKAIDEYLALAHYRQNHLPVVIARLFNTVGPRQVGSYGMVLPRFVASALKNEPLSVYGTGTQIRCFCDVRDVCKALINMLFTGNCLGKVFNVGSDVPISIYDLAQRVIKITNSNSQIRFIPYEDAYETGFEDLAVRQPDISKLKKATGFEPVITLDQTISDLAAYINNQ